MEYSFGYTSHEWYYVARSFIILAIGILMMIVLSGFLLLFDPQWLNTTLAGSIIQGLSIIVCATLSVYFGHELANRFFERKGKIIYNGNNIVINLNKKERTIELNSITLEKNRFSSFGDTNRLKGKIMGPIYVQYIIKTDAGDFSICSSSKEGWEKTKKEMLKGASKPRFTIEVAFEELAMEAGLKIAEY